MGPIALRSSPHAPAHRVIRADQHHDLVCARTERHECLARARAKLAGCAAEFRVRAGAAPRRPALDGRAWVAADGQRICGWVRRSKYERERRVYDDARARPCVGSAREPGCRPEPERVQAGSKRAGNMGLRRRRGVSISFISLLRAPCGGGVRFMSSLLTNVIRRQDVHLLALRSRGPACRARDGGAVRRQRRAGDRVLGARARGEHALGSTLREFSL